MNTGAIPTRRADAASSNRAAMQLETSGRKGKRPRAQERKRDKDAKRERERDIDTEKDRFSQRKHIKHST